MLYKIYLKFLPGSGSGWSQTQQNAYEDEQVASSSSLVFAKDVLTAHNSYRARHSTPPVTLDTTVSSNSNHDKIY